MGVRRNELKALAFYIYGFLHVEIISSLTLDLCFNGVYFDSEVLS